VDDRRRLELIDRIMGERHAIHNRLIVCLLALLEMGPTPGQRVYAEKLSDLWGLSADYASQTVRDLAREDLISVESFMGAAAGWRFLRLGPPLNGPRQVKRRCPRRPQPIVTDCDTGTPDPPAG